MSISFPPELADALKAYALEHGVTVSAVVVSAVRAYLPPAELPHEDDK